MTQTSFKLSIGTKILLGFSILILIFLGMALHVYDHMTEISVISEQAIPLSTMTNSVQDFTISIETLEKDIDKYFTVNYQENKEKVYKDFDSIKSILKSSEVMADNNSMARLLEMEKILSEIRTNFENIVNLEHNSTNSREINEIRYTIYQLLNIERQKNRELLLDTTDKIQANANFQKILNSKIIYEFLILGIFILVIGALISVITSRSISKPIEKLRAASTEIGLGYFNINIPVQSNDEVGQLASAFNNMAVELQKTTISKNYVENIFKSMFDMMFVASLDGTIRTVNKAICDLLGYNSEELIGQSIEKLVHDVIPNSASSNFIEFVKKGSIINLENYYLAKDGRKIPVLLSMSNMYDNKGNNIGVVCVARDITERKHLEELNIENIRLEHQSKAKTDFLAAMSHELRTPLNAIIGFSDVMIAGIGGNLNETHKGYVRDIHNAGEHLLVIINDILDLSKVEAEKMELAKEKLSVHELLEETITLIKNKAMNHHIDIIRDLDPQLEFMNGDKQKIKQILFNLLSNAVKFSKEDGGTITVTVKKSDDMVSFSISDTGIGIEKKNMNKLFKEFQQLDSGINRKYSGTGLGLMISRKFVELHGGKIIAESIYGKGSTFTFTIPAQYNSQKEGQ